MRFKRQIFSAVLMVAMVYIAYPFLTLYRLASAISDGNAEVLSTLVSWDSVREGVKEDICDAMTDIPAGDAAKETALRPFGYSFVRGVAANVVDANISPEALASAARSPQAAAISSGTGMTLNWAFFDSPRQFSVAIGMPGQPGPENELRLQMELRHGKWVVTRAWLPNSMLMAANSRT